jgi:predicted polyphosphate/ATP-dependent NAD kinase
MYGQSSSRLLRRGDKVSRLSTSISWKIIVIKLRSNRKSAYSPQSMNKIAKIIAENWDETWKIVWQRAQATQTIERLS